MAKGIVLAIDGDHCTVAIEGSNDNVKARIVFGCDTITVGTRCVVDKPPGLDGWVVCAFTVY